MKKRLFFILMVIVILLCSLLFTTSCNNVKKDKDYCLYTYEPVQGKFVKNNSKYIFEKENFYVYDNANTLINYGEYQVNENVVSLIPDKIGNANRLTATTSIILYKEFLINLTSPTVALRTAPTAFEDRSDLEGIYSLGFKLNNGNVYQSSDNSNTPSSFTEKIGRYQKNKDKDFLEIYEDGGFVQSFLIFSYTDRYGYEVKGLTQDFFCHKKIKFKKIDRTIVEFEKTIYENKSSGGGAASYSLSLMSYPNKEKITNGVTYKIIGANPSATLNGNSLSFTGTGMVQIEYSYGNFKGTDWIYIVDFEIKPSLPNASKTFSVGSVVAYDTIMLAVTNYVNYAFTYETVEIKNSSLAVAENGSVNFKEAGTVEATLIIRNVNKRRDGSDEVLELKQSIHLIIE